MRDSVFYSFLYDDKFMTDITLSSPCFSGLTMNKSIDKGKEKKLYDEVIAKFPKLNDGKEFINISYAQKVAMFEYIYIDQFKIDDTKEHIPRLIQLVNRVTPCEIVKINNKEYIKFKLLKTYDQTLFMLNFIRLLWYCQSGYGYDSNIFFKDIYNKGYKDALKTLTRANKLASANFKDNSYRNHSNASKNSKIISSKELFEWKGTSITELLKQ